MRDAAATQSPLDRVVTDEVTRARWVVLLGRVRRFQGGRLMRLRERHLWGRDLFIIRCDEACCTADQPRWKKNVEEIRRTQGKKTRQGIGTCRRASNRVKRTTHSSASGAGEDEKKETDVDSPSGPAGGRGGRDDSRSVNQGWLKARA